MRLLVIRHVAFEHLGLLAPVLEVHRLQFSYIDLALSNQDVLGLDDAHGLIVMGGPMSANDDLPYLRTEIAMIEQAIDQGLPVLGICLGSQLIAKACGARVYPNHSKEIGWAPVYWTGSARQDSLFSSFTQPETIFHWHSETFDLPTGAEWLVYSDLCAHQAYRIGSNIYGLQFHLEVTPEMIADWIGQDENCGDVRELTHPIDPHAHAGRQKEVARIVFDRWAQLVIS